MISVEWPAEMLGNPRPDEIAEGPFVMEHNGIRKLGSRLERNGSVLMVSDGSRAYTFDDSYTAEVHGDSVTFDSAKYHSTFVFRPLILEDAAWALPNEDISSVEGLRAEVLGMLDAAQF